MQLELKKYLLDIQDSINGIYEYLGEVRDYKVFSSNRMMKKAIEREFEIIGEAMKRVLDLNPDIQITNARKIVDFRNWVIHGYDHVDDVIVWGIIIKDLPRLKEEVASLLEN